MRLVHNRKKVSGFTLVEMAIVLVIIGIILAGVMKGRDIVRGAQVKQFSQQFAQKWGTISNTYYDKTGQFLNDGTPNGGDTGSDADGVMDGNIVANSQSIYDVLVAAGIDPCLLLKSKLIAHQASTALGTPTDVCGSGTAAAGTADRVAIYQTLVDGEYAANNLVTVDLVGINLTMGGQVYARNLVVLYNLPPDVARGLDTAIDGTANGLIGACVGLGGVYAKDGESAIAAEASVTATAWGAVRDSSNAAQSQTLGIILDY